MNSIDLNDRKKMYASGRVPIEDEALKKLLRQGSMLIN